MAILLIGKVWKGAVFPRIQEIWPFLIPFHTFPIRSIAMEIQCLQQILPNIVNLDMLCSNDPIYLGLKLKAGCPADLESGLIL